MSALPPVPQTVPQLYLQLHGQGHDALTLTRVAVAATEIVHATVGMFRGSLKPFSAHLVGVAALVAEAGEAADVIVAALLHASCQDRVRGAASCAEVVARIAATHGAEVATLVAAYHAVEAGAELPAEDPRARAVAVLHLCDEIEDGLDLGGWLHGQPEDLGHERGSAGFRLARLAGYADWVASARFDQSGLLRARYATVLAQARAAGLPTSLRTGRYTSYALGS
ncbi:MAG: HD domain-containing protein [Xanthomonadales bacterium]|nr:HD domain-containing protein [Xanthomonadales bacterium]